MIMTTKQLSTFFDVGDCMMRTWLCNFQFEKFRKVGKRPAKFYITKDFLKTLEDYLGLKHSEYRLKKLNKIADLYKKIENEV